METPNIKKRISKEKLEEYAKTNQFQFWQLCEQYRINDKEYYEEVAKPLIEKYKQKEDDKTESLKNKSRYLIYVLIVVIIFLIGISYYFWSKAYEFNQERKALKDSLLELDKEYTSLEKKYTRETKEKKKYIEELASLIPPPIHTEQENEQKFNVNKFSGYNREWVFVCTDENRTKYYIEDKDIQVFDKDKFRGYFLNVYSSYDYPTDNSVVAYSGCIEFNISKRTNTLISSATYYAGKPSRFGYSDMREKSIAPESVIEFLFKAFKKRINN